MKEVFLKVDGLLGGAKQLMHRGEFEMDYFSFGDTSKHETVLTEDADKPNLYSEKKITFTPSGPHKAQLVSKLVRGEHLPHMVVTITRAKKQGDFAYFRAAYTLTDCSVSRVYFPQKKPTSFVVPQEDLVSFVVSYREVEKRANWVEK